ncbi:polycystic kidney disease 2-like 1 protein isoform X2 [Cimex lectularius]|uniref:Polycystin-2-like n=1 Tax=Cimex lectularius TaxID=79782 RepID=A0A8I6TDP6_CIMLE|nr:polycystic kidney disease 2-like 1 protein isoform X2 [Cimex lectularius]
MDARKGRKSVTKDLVQNRNRKGCFETLSSAREKGRVKYLQASVKDFLIFLLFMTITLMTVVLYEEKPSSHFFQVVRHLVVTPKFLTPGGLPKSFTQIKLIDEIWNYFDWILLPAIYNTSYTHKDRLQKDVYEEKTDENLTNLIWENVLVGNARIRQVRVKNDSCSIPKTFEHIYNSCFYYYNPISKDNAPFGLQNSSIWTYNDAEKTKSYNYFGTVSHYDGGGYFLDLPYAYTHAKHFITEMFNNTWIDQATRAIFIDFTIYSLVSNLFCPVKLVLELPPSGGVMTKYHIKPTKLSSYTTKWDFMRLGLELAVLLFIIYYIIQEINEFIILKIKYCVTFSNMLNLVIILVGLIFLFTVVYRFVIVRHFKNFVLSILPGHVEFDTVTYVQQVYEANLGLLACIVCIKFVRFAYLTREGAFIIHSWEKVEKFSTIGKSVFTLISQIAGGKFYYKECTKARPIFTLMFYIVYTFLVVFIFMNWIIALFCHGMALTAREHGIDRDSWREFFITDTVFNCWFRLMKLFRKDEAVEKMRKAEKLHKYKTDFEIITILLKRNGFLWLERILFMRRHKINTDSHLSEKQMNDIVADINGISNLYSEVQEHDSIMEFINMLQRRIEEVEHNMADIVVKVDVLIDKMTFQEDHKKLDEQKRMKEKKMN